MEKCYYIEDEALNYADAMVNCQNRLSMGRLFEPQDLLTNNQVVASALLVSPSDRQTSDFWIGMNDISTEGIFQYTTGGDLVFTHWSYGEPNDSQVIDFSFFGSGFLFFVRNDGQIQSLLYLSFHRGTKIVE